MGWGKPFRRVERAVIRPIGRVVESGLNAVFNTVDSIMSDPKKLAAVAVSIAFPGAAQSIGNAVLPASMAGSATASIIGNTVLNTVSSGGKVEDAFKSAIIQFGAQELTNSLKTEFAANQVNSYLANVAAKATTDVALATIMGKDPVAALLFSGAKAATDLITNQVFESIGIKDDYDKLPSVAKDTVTAALTAAMTGKDIGQASAFAIVNGGINTLRKGIALQTQAQKTGRDLFSLPELEQKLSLSGLTESSIPAFIEGLNEAEDIFQNTVPVNFEETLAKNSSLLSFGDKDVSEDEILSIAAAAIHKDKYGEDTSVIFNRPDKPYGGMMYGNDPEYYKLKRDIPAIKEGWESGSQKEYFERRFNQSNNPNVSEAFDYFADWTRGLSDRDRQIAFGYIAGDDGIIDTREVQRAKEIIPIISEYRLADLGQDDMYGPLLQVRDFVGQGFYSPLQPPTEPVPAPAPEVIVIPDESGNQLVIDQNGTVVDIIPPAEPVPESTPEFIPAPEPIPEPAPIPTPVEEPKPVEPAPVLPEAIAPLEPQAPTDQIPEVITLPPDEDGNQLVIDQNGNIVDIIPPAEPNVVEPVPVEPVEPPVTEPVTEPVPEVITLPPDENGNQYVIDTDGNVVDIIPPSEPEQPEPTTPPFQGPMGPMTEDQIKRYNDEFAKYLDYLQAGQPLPPEYGVQDLGITPENWESFNENLLTMQQEGKLPTQWKPGADGSFTFTSDDGSTLTIDDSGNILGYTEAPIGNLPGEVPAGGGTTTGGGKLPTGGGGTPTGGGKPTGGTGSTQAQSGLGLLSMLPILATQQPSEQVKPFYSPTVQYVDVEDPFQIVGLGNNQNTKTTNMASGGYLDELLAQFERRN